MAESQFYAILTDQGAALEATALATGTPVTLDKFVIGDGGGNAVTPDPTRTTLVNEVYRGTIQKAESQGNQVTFTLYVPPEAGGYTIREAGILTADGTLYSLSNSPDILKPTESNGAVISITFKYILAVSSTSTVNVNVVNNEGISQTDADKLYYRRDKRLSEIKDEGAEAQKETQLNIGINLDDYYTKEESDERFCTSDEVNTLINNNPDSVSGFGAVNSTVFAGFMYNNETVMHFSPGDNIEGSLLFPAYMYHRSAQIISETVNSIMLSSESLSGVWTLSGYMPQSVEPTDGGAESIFNATFATNFIRVA
ncbi:hypothetical protein DKP34_16710 [Salmonella enterica subsp. enterica serovar Enteritidis]|nr:hypothetical protein [Salmonella enterica]EBU6659024.1 hypothetical protein [Salmonella enterica subsp. enterica serovar Enteritidis]